MANTIDDIIDGVNPPAAARAHTRRLQVANLTSIEQQGLREQGFDIDGRDFVDIEIDAPETRSTTEDQRKAAELLKSPVTTAVPVEPPAPQEDPQVVKELRAQIKQLEERLLSIPPVCNRCGWPAGEPRKIEPTHDDLRSFLRAVMSGEQFSKSYTLFDGAVEVVLRTRTGEEDLAVKACLRKMLRSNEIAQQADLIAYARRYNFCCSIVSYTSTIKSVTFPPLELPKSGEAFYVENLELLVQARMRQLPSQVLSLLMCVYDNFSELVDLLVAKAEDPGFWKGIAISR